LLQQANPWTDGYGLMEGTYADLQLFGDAYWFRVQPDSGEPTPSELWRMMPSRITPVADRETFVRRFTYRVPSGGTQEFTPQEVVWFRRYNPGNPLPRHLRAGRMAKLRTCRGPHRRVQFVAVRAARHA